MECDIPRETRARGMIMGLAFFFFKCQRLRFEVRIENWRVSFLSPRVGLFGIFFLFFSFLANYNTGCFMISKGRCFD